MPVKRLLAVIFLFASIASAQSVPNTWVDNGTAITGGAHGAWQPKLLYEGNAQILSGTVFKMLYANNDGNGINYAESTDGLTWTNYSGNPVIANYNYLGGFYKYQGTYYLYASATTVLTSIDAFTSPDGITWTKQVSGALTDSTSTSSEVFQLNVITVDSSGNWWGMYAPIVNGSFPGKIATSTDGLHWTPETDSPALGVGYASTFIQIGQAYYGWGQAVPQGWPGATGIYPTDIARYSALSPGGPWTALGSFTLYRNLSSEQPNNVQGQVADPSIVSANGNMYMCFDAGSNDTAFQINCAKAASTTPIQLVESYEGVSGVPIPGSVPGASYNWPIPKGYPASTLPSLNMAVSASDNFTRADANPIGGNWTPLSTSGSFSAAQIVSDKVTCATAGDWCDSYYTAVTWPNDQWATVQILVDLVTTDEVGVALRQSGGNDYRFKWKGEAGMSGTWYIEKNAAGTLTTLASGTVTMSDNDYITGAVVGANLYFYYNGNLIGAASDSSYASGSAGFMVRPITLTTNAYIGNWSGGGFQSAGSITLPSILSGNNQSIVQSNAEYFGSGSKASSSLAYNSNNVAGHLIFATVWYNSVTAGGLSSFTDTQGNTWTALPAESSSSSDHWTQAFYCLSAKAGANTVTANYPGGAANFDTIIITEYSGSYTAGPHNEAASDSTTTMTVSATTTQPNSLLLGYLSNFNPVGPGTGWYLGQVPTQNTLTAGSGLLLEYLVGQSAGTYAATANQKVVTHWSGGIASFYSTALSPAATPTFSPVPGGYGTSQTVTISSSTSGGIIYYTTDGTDPNHTSNSILNGGTVVVSIPTILKAMESASGFADSAIASGAYGALSIQHRIMF